MDYYEKETTNVKIKVLPCVECGCKNIDIGDAGYSTFNVAWAKCTNCDISIHISPCRSNIKVSEIAKDWNAHNDPDILRRKYKEQIADLQERLNALPNERKHR